MVEEYSYDANGNRLKAVVYGTTSTASHTLDDQLEVYGDNTYRYNSDGYLSEKITPNGLTTYTYGIFGELKKVITPTKTIEYLHNANNQRVAKIVNTVVVEKYLWANLTTLLAIYDGNDNLVQRFEYSDSRMPIAMVQGTDKYYLHYDQVGSLRGITDTNGNFVKKISYDSYGNILSDSNPTFKIPFRFAGGLHDPDTNLTRFGFRDYDSFTGKWTAKDPIDFNGGDFNLYGYVNSNPINGIDPSGLSSFLVFYLSNKAYSSLEKWVPILHDNRYFLNHYFFGFGKTMDIKPNSYHGKLIRKHLDITMKNNYNSIMDASSNICGNYRTTIEDNINFTNNRELFSIGDSNLKTTAICTDGKCLIRYQIRDHFIDALDINDALEGNQDISIPYNINFDYVIRVGF